MDGGGRAFFPGLAALWRHSLSYPTQFMRTADPWVDEICPTPPHAPQLSTQVMMLPEYPCDATAAAPTT